MAKNPNPIEPIEPAENFSALEMAPVRRRSYWPFIIIIVLILAAVFLWFTRFGVRAADLLSRGASGNYQAVFLTNNQVYFGRLSRENSQYVSLTDVFYLQAGQPAVQPNDPNNNVNLIKLGNELHGPTDKMRINRDQILFIEDLRDDSQVVQAIKQFKGQQNQGQ